MYFLPPGRNASDLKMIQGVKYLRTINLLEISIEQNFQQRLWVGILDSSYILSFQGKVEFSYKTVLSILWIWFWMNLVFVHIEEFIAFVLNWIQKCFRMYVLI